MTNQIDARVADKLKEQVKAMYELTLAQDRIHEAITLPTIDHDKGWYVDISVWGKNTSHITVSYSCSLPPREVAADIIKIRRAWLGSEALRVENVSYASSQRRYTGSRAYDDYALHVDLTVSCALPSTCTVEYRLETREVRVPVVTCA